MRLPFDKVYCLNISKVQDRRKYMEEMFRENNVENDIIFTEYTDLDFMKNNKHTHELCRVLYSMFDIHERDNFTKHKENKMINCLSCLANHYQIIKYNYDIGTDTICVFEDDAKITDKELFEHYLNNLPDDWDIIRYGILHWYDFSGDTNLYNKKIQKECIVGNQCYAMNRKGMELYIDYITNNRILYADLIWENINTKCNIYYTKDKLVLPSYKFKSVLNNFVSY